jgi:RHH-type transcriptional regulator, rel operon repressor / antitoxin RelB
MATVSIRIDDDTKHRWNSLAKTHGLNQSELFRQAIMDKLEELEDFYVVRERLAQPFKSVSNDDVWKDLGIED